MILSFFFPDLIFSFNYPDKNVYFMADSRDILGHMAGAIFSRRSMLFGSQITEFHYKQIKYEYLHIFADQVVCFVWCKGKLTLASKK